MVVSVAAPFRTSVDYPSGPGVARMLMRASAEPTTERETITQLRTAETQPYSSIHGSRPEMSKV